MDFHWYHTSRGRGTLPLHCQMEGEGQWAPHSASIDSSREKGCPDIARKRWKSRLRTCTPLTAPLVGRVASLLLGESRNPGSTQGLHWFHYGVWRRSLSLLGSVESPGSSLSLPWHCRKRIGEWHIVTLGSARSPNFPLGLFWYCPCRDREEHFITFSWEEVDVQVSLVFSTDTAVGVRSVRERHLFTTRWWW